MMFNRKKDLLQQHVILKEIFKERYGDLSHEERNEVRQAIFDLEELICDRYMLCNNVFNPYKYIFANANTSIVSNKVLEIVDKLSFSDKDLFITKTRACGITNILVAFTMWTCLNEKPKDTNTIWVVSPNCRMSEEFNTKFRMYISNLGNRPNICNKKEIEFNGWRIHFMTTTSPDSMCGKHKPFMVIMDEVGCNMDTRFEFYNRLRGCHPDVRVIETRTRVDDEINRYVGVLYGGANQSKCIYNANVQWFHDLKKCKGLRFERTLNRIDNTIKIADEDIPTVIGNDDYLYNMIGEGWRLNSDWLENWDKMQLKNTGDDVKPVDPETKIELITSINNAVMGLCEAADMKLYGPNTHTEIVEFFKDCKDTNDVKKMKKKLMTLINPIRNNKDNTEGYVNLIKDVFEL